MDGVVRMPSAFSMTFGVLPSITATHEFVVPRSIPMTFPMVLISFFLRQVGWALTAPRSQPPTDKYSPYWGRCMARKEADATFVRKSPQPLKIVSRRGYGRTVPARDEGARPLPRCR